MLLILGAGPAGLGAAHATTVPYRIFEQAAVGGLSRSFEVEGRIFDYGGHAFFTSHEEVRTLLWSAQRQPPFVQLRRAFIWHDGTVIPYPFQGNLRGLPPDVIVDCLTGLIAAVESRTGRAPTNLAEWLQQSFGEGICRHFMTPYNEKVWAFPLNTIVPEWVGHRIVQPDFRSIVAGAITDRTFTSFPNNQVAYPAEGGFGAFYSALVDTSVEPNLTFDRATAVYLDRKVVDFSSGRQVAYDQLITSVDLDEFIGMVTPVPGPISELRPDLQHNSLAVVSLVISGLETDMQRLYVADSSVIFHKLVFNSNSAPSLRRAQETSVQCEISFSAHKPLPAGDLLERAVSDLDRVGLLPAGSDVVAADLRYVDKAYPVSTAASIAAREGICDWLVTRDVHPVGRFGAWRYVNSDGACYAGMCAAREAVR